MSLPRAFRQDKVEQLERRLMLTTASVSSANVLVISGTKGNDTIVVNLNSNKTSVSVTGVTPHFTEGSGKGDFTSISIDAGAGNDSVTINGNVKYTRATILGDDGNDTLTGGNGADSIVGGLGNDKLFGEAGNDTLVGADGESDSLDGGAGTDVADSDSFFVKGKLANDVHTSIEKTLAIDDAVDVDGLVFVVEGTSGNDSISGSVDKSTNDLNVVINGVAFSYTPQERLAVLTANAGGQQPSEGVNRIAFIGGLGNDTINAGAGIEDVLGSEGNDQLTATDDTQDIVGGAGNDLITTKRTSANDLQEIYGDNNLDGLQNLLPQGISSDGNDTINGSQFSDLIDGGGGADVIRPGKSAPSSSNEGEIDDDQISLEGDQRDTIDFTNRTDNLAINMTFDGTDFNAVAQEPDGGANVIIFNTKSAPVMIGGSGNDIITGSSLGDSLVGGAGNDTLSGGAGNDTMDGGLGADVMGGGTGNDTVTYANRTTNLNISLDNLANDGAAGEHDNVMADVDTIIGGSGNDKIAGNPFANMLIGGGGNDTLFGGSGNDTLEGDAGHDQLFGQDGNDLLLGKDGQVDTLDGGDGTDTAQRDNSSTVKDVVDNVEVLT